MRPMFENDAALEATLRALRPDPDPEFAARLDERAAAGFPGDAGSLRARLAALGARLRATPPRRILAPAGALALFAIVVSSAVIATSGNDEDGGSGDQLGQLSKSDSAEEPTGRGGGGHPRVEAGGTGSVQYEGSLPVTPSASAAAPETSGSSGASYHDVPHPALPQAGTGPYASGRERRSVERSASIVLGTEPDGLRDAAAGVFDAVHAADGIVLRSSVDGGPNGGAADFELLIPSAKLGDALASISSIAEVRSRQEASDDITAPTVSAGERLQDANAAVRGLLDQLAAADTDAERVAAEAELRAARAQAASLRSRLATLERRANLSRVSVRIETGGKSDSGSGSGAWGVGDGLDGAGRVLAVAGGIVVIGLAALAPFALIALLAWLAYRVWLNRARRNALSRP